jgi:hypothetical protein
MKKYCFDLLARGNSHCCHHLGILKYYEDYELNIHASSNLLVANEFYNGANFELKNVNFFNIFYLYIYAIKMLLLKNVVIFAGLHLRQAIYLFPFIVFNYKVTIHLHGQAHALERKSAKYWIWKIISLFANLEVGNPAWVGPSFIKKIHNINELFPLDKPNNNNNLVLFYSSTKKPLINEAKLEIQLAKNNLELIKCKHGVSYKELDGLFRSVSYIYLDYSGNYYSYSPCGHISDAINYGLKVVINKDDFLNIEVIKKYNVKYIVI